MARRTRLSEFIQSVGGLDSAERLLQILSNGKNGSYQTFSQLWSDLAKEREGIAIQPILDENGNVSFSEVTPEVAEKKAASDAFATPPEVFALIRNILRKEMRGEMQEIRKELAELRKASEPD